MEHGKISNPQLSEAERFKQKFPGQGAPNNTAFLRKRLQGGTKYFDSGDYYSAKSTERKDPSLVRQAIPTVDKLPQRKPSASRLSSLCLADGDPAAQQNSDEKCEVTETEEQKSKLQVVE